MMLCFYCGLKYAQKEAMVEQSDQFTPFPLCIYIAAAP